MATIDRVAWGALGGVGFLGVVLAGWLVWPVPQIGADERVMKSVDALFTALTSKDAARLARCKGALEAHEKEGKLSAAAANRLKAIMDRAEAGEWRPAAESLYTFIQAQRREGAR